MIRKIIKIDEDKCNGCGLCAKACHEGAIAMVNGKAKLIRDDYCDGLGNCLPVCPTGAIGFEEREAAAYDQSAVDAHIAQQNAKPQSGCPGTMAKAILQKKEAPKACPGTMTRALSGDPAEPAPQADAVPSRLNQWPVQIKLVPINAPYFNNANLLVSADCAAYAYGNFHAEFMKNKVTLIGCPKLDQVDYSDKLTEILANNPIKSITAVRMEVPCCGGIEYAVQTALRNSGKMIPWRVITLSLDGRILED